MTTPSLLQAMVEALRDGVRHLQWWVDVRGGDEPRAAKESDEKLAKMHAALDAWGKRPRLRDQPELRKAVSVALALGQMQTQDVFEQSAAALDRDRAAARILDALEALLFGERG